MKVTLISHTKDCEKIVASAAKLCYSSKKIKNLQSDLTCEKTKKFINMLSELEHESPIEHVSFTFGIEGVSRSLLAQITRHRIASFSVQSQRYVSEEKLFSYVIPPEIKNSPEASAEFKKSMVQCKKSYNKLLRILKDVHIKKLTSEERIEEKKSEIEIQKLAQKYAIEDARFVLPNAAVTKMICTFNARSLKNFFSRRLCNRAQWEIRKLAILMLKEVLKIAPNLFSRVGPSCVFSFCKEGSMTCSNASKVREFFKKLMSDHASQETTEKKLQFF
ncbi:MAG: FAD-dependent thymidylate synthase [Oscillospiraceae bacterium]|jgi:thymidylate synthase (FAD)|nr:FAD-dependent thymidylate synthase [Oscillospiraceae bacterium]